MREPSDRKKIRMEYKEYREKLRQAKKDFDIKHFKSHQEFMNHVQDLDGEYKFHKNRKHRDFERYYRNFRIVRPMPIVLILILWSIIFLNTGLSNSLGIVLLILTIMVTVGSVFQMIFNFRLEKRILKPIDYLKKGMQEITKGNYDIQVQPDTHSYIDILIADFNDMARRLKETEKLKAEYEENRKDLIANISHDLKTPITSIQGYIEAIYDTKGIPAEKADKYLKIIHNNIVYMNRLIDDLFLFAKLDMQKLAFTYTEVFARPFMHDLMEEFRLDLEEQNVAFIFMDKMPADCMIRIDAKRFHQVLRNIIDNAVKYGPDTGLSLQTDLFMESGNICITLTDNGPGIPEDKIGMIFKRFYRLDVQRTKDIASTGLGLAIAKELIEMQGGSISAENNPAGGTRFTITLPPFQGAQGGAI
ncbi:MAG: HAMP domain-containing sensor histidine kinase [Eubacteriales bacterium]